MFQAQILCYDGGGGPIAITWRIAPLPWEEEGSSVPMERDSGPLPLHRRVAPLPLGGEGSSVSLERNDGSLPLHGMCGPLQFEGGALQLEGGGVHCRWIGKMPFATGKIMVYYNRL